MEIQINETFAAPTETRDAEYQVDVRFYDPNGNVVHHIEVARNWDQSDPPSDATRDIRQATLSDAFGDTMDYIAEII